MQWIFFEKIVELFNAGKLGEQSKDWLKNMGYKVIYNDGKVTGITEITTKGVTL